VVQRHPRIRDSGGDAIAHREAGRWPNLGLALGCAQP
jgi:hypothetical protein